MSSHIVFVVLFLFGIALVSSNHSTEQLGRNDGGAQLCDAKSNDSQCALLMKHFRSENLGIDIDDRQVINNPVNMHMKLSFAWVFVLFLNILALVLFFISGFVMLISWDSDLPDSYFVVYMRDAIITLSRLEDQGSENYNNESVPASLRTN